MESNNEYWMRYDAKLRTDFHITTGYQEDEVEMVRNKALMKKGYLKAHIKSADKLKYSLIHRSKTLYRNADILVSQSQKMVLELFRLIV